MEYLENNLGVTTPSGVYQILNKINGKRYIGSSKDVFHRLNRHIYLLQNNKHDNKYLQRAVTKYGIENFEFKPLLICELTERLIYEQKLMNIYKSANYDFGYNQRPIVDSNLGHKQTKETKEAIKKLLIEKFKDKDFREKQQASLNSEEARAKRIKTSIERGHYKRYKELQKDMWTEEKRKEMSVKIKLLSKTPEHILKLKNKSDKFYEAMKSPELLEKKSELLKKRWADPVFREKMINSKKKGTNND